MANQIYRPQALERLSSPEQLDLLMPVTDTRGWIALIGIGMLLAVGFVWSIFGMVATTVQGNGLLMRFGGFQLIRTQYAGEIVKVLVTEEQDVKEGDEMLHLVRTGTDGREVTEIIKSPRNGRILDVAVMIGTLVDAEAVLASVEAMDYPLQAVVYVPVSDGYKVEAGMEVKLLPATERKQSSTYLRGHVRNAAKFPSTQAGMMRSLQNAEWVNSMLTGGPVLEIVLEMTSDPATAKLHSGTPCQAIITIHKRRPIEFLLPLFEN